MLILGFADSRPQAKRLADTLNCAYSDINVHRFPDGESKVTLPESLPESIVIFRSLDRPNDKLIELLLSCETARQQGVQHITLIAPYLCYMRQDVAFHPGEVISQKIIGNWLGSLVDRLITVDPHLHRVHSLGEVMPNTETQVLSATALMAEFLKKRPSNPIIIGPDEESQQWVEQLAEAAGLEWAIAKKLRHGDFNVEVRLPDLDFNRRHVVLVDDVISTGRTIKQAANQLKQLGADHIHCLVVHALFADQNQLPADIGVSSIWSSDSIGHESNTIPLTKLYKDVLTR